MTFHPGATVILIIWHIHGKMSRLSLPFRSFCGNRAGSFKEVEIVEAGGVV